MSFEAEWPVFWRGLADHGSRWRLVPRVRLLVTPSAAGMLVYFTVNLKNSIQRGNVSKGWVTYEEVSDDTGWRPKQTICVKGCLSTARRFGRHLGTYQSISSTLNTKTAPDLTVVLRLESLRRRVVRGMKFETLNLSKKTSRDLPYNLSNMIFHNLLMNFDDNGIPLSVSLLCVQYREGGLKRGAA